MKRYSGFNDWILEAAAIITGYTGGTDGWFRLQENLEKIRPDDDIEITEVEAAVFVAQLVAMSHYEECDE